ncbi:formyltransferase family protein [Aliarcobacter butzleri]|uniref:formyltransferase family protein n=1 Tax=Aliarcobacter butzleri TaxID=28197 RepID=UPI0021B6DE94|nr:formyltransferase family protein [Aliarcobacter butzleri]MCT7574920.1 formyltransferase family protein [Aliarcobacter butzleri]MDK2081351.1 formyltransferase family protein [Aliarcobacter butzleri]
MKIAILTSPNQWFVPYAEILNKKLGSSKLYFNHEDILENYDIVFILSYHKIISKEYLSKHNHNIVIHASELPRGKGWAPMFWQILEGKNEIPFSMFEVDEGVDSGEIYMQRILKLTGYELNEELREKQAKFTIDMCLDFVENYDKYKVSKPQIGQESFYQKRSEKDSKLDIDKSIKEQFNLLRIVDNENYPAYFEIDGYRYVLKIELTNVGGDNSS